MLKSIKRISSKGLYDYLTNDRAVELGKHSSWSDYYTCIEGKAWGKGCEHLRFQYGKNKDRNLADVGMSKDTFNRLAEGCWRESPLREAPKRQLVQTQNGKHVAGYDLVFSPAKSVSAEALVLEGEERSALMRAHQIATKAGFDALEANALLIRQPTDEWGPRAGSKTQRSATKHVEGELIAFASSHWTSRPTRETIERDSGADPQLHTHVFVMNVAWNPQRERFQCLDHNGIIKAQKLAEAVYQTTLATELQKLGYKLEWHEDRRSRRTFELAGSDPKLREFLSTRHREVVTQERAWQNV